MQSMQCMSKPVGGCNVASLNGVACRRPNQCLLARPAILHVHVVAVSEQWCQVASMSQIVGCLVMPFIHAQEGVDVSIDGPQNIIMVCKSVHKALYRCRICLIPKAVLEFQVCLDPLCLSISYAGVGCSGYQYMAVSCHGKAGRKTGPASRVGI